MSPSEERGDALRWIEGLENGTSTAHDSAVLAERLDPVLVYVLTNYLRAIHPAGDPAAAAVLERVVKMTTAVPSFVRRHREGGEDPISQWFESEYAYTDFRGRREELVDVLIDKIES